MTLSPHQSHHRRRDRRAFTLLEVLVALGIMAVAMVVLVESQTAAVFMTTESNRIRTSTMLANERMKEVVLQLEVEGWSSSDIEEEGDFSDFGNEEFRGDALHLEFAEGELEEYRWAYTVRSIDLQMPSDLGAMAGDLAGGGYWGDLDEQPDVGGAPDLADFGFGPDKIAEMLSPYLREVRVIVWWGENEEELDQIEIVHHVINPSGAVTDPDQDDQSGGGNGSGSSGGSSSGGSGGGGKKNKKGGGN
jgi:prepilin-type N-terminal cleavage/methylation domain-containing protein